MSKSMFLILKAFPFKIYNIIAEGTKLKQKPEPGLKSI